MNLRVFLCHAKEDKERVRTIYKELKKRGFSPWLDEEDLVGGQDWDLEISKAVRSSEVVVVCLSENSISKKGYVQKEIRVALDAADYHPEGQIYIIPVRLTPCEIPERLSKWHAIDLFGKKGFDRLERSLLTRTVVDALWNSSEYDPRHPENDLENLQEIRSALVNVLPPTTDELLDEMSHSVKRLKRNPDFDNARLLCVTTRTLVIHLFEILYKPKAGLYTQVKRADKLFDESKKYLGMIKDAKAKCYIKQSVDRAKLVKRIRANLPRRRM